MKKQFKSCRIKTSCCSFSEYLDQSVLVYTELHGNFLDDKRTKQKHLKTLVWILKPGLLGSVRLSFSSFPLGVAVALHLFCISLCQPNPPNQFKCFAFPSGESDLKENSRLKFRLAIRDNFLTSTGSLYLAV